jgi:hypothetical protein
MSQNNQDKKQKQIKVQGLYREIKQNRDDKNDNKIGAVIVSVCVFIIFLVFVMGALFDSGIRFGQFFGR